MTNKDIVRKIILREVEAMQPMVQSFEDNPIEFLLQKYPTMRQTLEMLMSSAYKDYITGIYIVAPKPTTFKIELINGQDFNIKYIGKGKFNVKVAGKQYHPDNLGDAERCSQSIADLLELNYAPAEGKEQTSTTPEAGPGAEELGPELAAAGPETTPPAETPTPEEETPPAEA
jgi:hypothetical protein